MNKSDKNKDVIEKETNLLKEKIVELKKAELRYRTLFETTGTTTMLVNQDMTIEIVNQEAFNMTGYKPEELIGRKWSEFVMSGDLEMMKEYHHLRRSEPGKVPKKYEVRLVNKEGQVRYVVLDISMIPETSQSVVSINDITERKQIEEALKENEKRFKQFFKSNAEYCYMISPEGNILDVNNTVLVNLGYDKNEIIGKNLVKTIYSPTSQKKAKHLLDEWTKTGKIRNEEMTIVTKNGVERTVILNVDAVKNAEGKILHSTSIQTDITERKKAEKVQLVLYNIAKAVNTTKNLDELYHTIHHHLGNIIDNNNFYIALYNEDKNMISFPYYIDEKDAKPEPVPQKLSKGLTNYVLQTGKSLLATKEDYKRLAKEGKIDISGSISEEWIGIPLRIDKKIIGVMALQSYKDASAFNEKDLEILEHISYQIAIAIENKRTEQINLRLSETIRNARDGIILTTPKGRITYINPAFEKMSGYKLSELLNTDPANLIVKEDTAAIGNEIRYAVKETGEWKRELYCKRKNGDIYPIETHVFAIHNANGELEEIAAIQQDITDRKKAEEDLERIFNLSSDMICISGFDGYAKRLNPAFEKSLGYSNDEILSRPFIDFVHPDDREATINELKKLTSGVTINHFEQRCSCKDGSYKNLSWSNSPVVEEDLMYAIAHDITDQKKMEEELSIAKKRLKIANSILRHDVTNDLVVIKSALDIYQDQNDKTMLDEIEKRVEKSLNRIYMHEEHEKFVESYKKLEEYNLVTVLNEVTQNYPGIKIAISGTGEVYADNEIYSVFENIINNAIQHGDTKKIDIEIDEKEEYCEIRFKDYGICIPENIKDKIFDNGFQYGKKGHTGIGLYNVEKTIENYNGEIEVADNKPKGTIFIIRLRKIIKR